MIVKKKNNKLKCIFGEDLKTPAEYISGKRIWVCSQHDVMLRHDILGESIQQLTGKWRRTT